MPKNKTLKLPNLDFTAEGKEHGEEVKGILKIIVLNEPYFPRQKLSIRFSNQILREIMADEGEPISSGTLFGIVSKLPNNRIKTHAKFGTACEVEH